MAHDDEELLQDAIDGEHPDIERDDLPANLGAVGDDGASHQKAMRPRFIAYEALRDELIARGIPRHEIAFIQDAQNRNAREALMAAVRSGAVRVLLAGSQNTGLNVQERLLAVHNADVPWRPGDLEQRLGRAQRQGNFWPEIYVCNYAVEGSFDAFMWQTNEVKAQFIAQFERGDVTVRELDDIGGIVMTAAEMKAIASGNPQIRRKFEVESELARLDLLRFAWSDTRRRMHGRISEIDAQCEQARTAQALLRAVQATVEGATTADFQAQVATTIGGNPTSTVSKRVEAGAAVRDLAATVCQLHGIEQLERHELWRWMIVQRVVLAQYRGLLLECVVGKFGQATVMLALAGRGEPTLIPETALAATTGRGVFDSADAAMRQFGERITAIDHRLAQLEAEQRTILAAIGQPWEHEAAYQTLVEEQDALLQALGPSETGEAETTTALVDKAPSSAAPLVIPTPVSNAPQMAAPPVMLPPLRDAAAMQAARERIKALERERSAPAAPSAVQTLFTGPAQAPTLECLGPAEEAHLEAVRNLYQPAGKLVFGDTTAAAPSKRRKPAHTPALEAGESTEQLSLFS